LKAGKRGKNEKGIGERNGDPKDQQTVSTQAEKRGKAAMIGRGNRGYLEARQKSSGKIAPERITSSL